MPRHSTPRPSFPLRLPRQPPAGRALSGAAGALYVLLFIAGARNERLALATLWFGLVYHLACISSNLDFTARYHAAPSAALSFAAGAVNPKDMNLVFKA